MESMAAATSALELVRTQLQTEFINGMKLLIDD